MFNLLFHRLTIAEILGITTMVAIVAATSDTAFIAILLFAFVNPLFLGIAWAGTQQSTFRAVYRHWVAFCISVSIAAIPNYSAFGMSLIVFSSVSTVVYIPLFNSG